MRLGKGAYRRFVVTAEQEGGTVTSQRVPCGNSVAVGQLCQRLPGIRSESSYEWLLMPKESAGVGRISNQEKKLPLLRSDHCCCVSVDYDPAWEVCQRT
jgi:hypothetical protein